MQRTNNGAKATTVDSNQLSYARCMHRKRSGWAPIDGGRDAACGRYMHKYTHNCMYEHENMNNCTNIIPMNKPFGALDS